MASITVITPDDLTDPERVLEVLFERNRDTAIQFATDLGRKDSASEEVRRVTRSFIEHYASDLDLCMTCEWPNVIEGQPCRNCNVEYVEFEIDQLDCCDGCGALIDDCVCGDISTAEVYDRALRHFGGSHLAREAGLFVPSRFI